MCMYIYNWVCVCVRARVYVCMRVYVCVSMYVSIVKAFVKSSLWTKDGSHVVKMLQYQILLLWWNSCVTKGMLLCEMGRFCL